MAIRSLVSLRGFIEGVTGGLISLNPADMQNTSPPQFVLQDVLQAGDNIVLIPALAKGLLVVFDPTSTTTKKIKAVVGDTGMPVSKNGWLVISFDSPPPVSFYINSSVIDTGKYTAMYFF